MRDQDAEAFLNLHQGETFLVDEIYSLLNAARLNETRNPTSAPNTPYQKGVIELDLNNSSRVYLKEYFIPRGGAAELSLVTIGANGENSLQLQVKQLKWLSENNPMVFQSNCKTILEQWREEVEPKIPIEKINSETLESPKLMTIVKQIWELDKKLNELYLSRADIITKYTEKESKIKYQGEARPYFMEKNKKERLFALQKRQLQAKKAITQSIPTLGGKIFGTETVILEKLQQTLETEVHLLKERYLAEAEMAERLVLENTARQEFDLAEADLHIDQVKNELDQLSEKYKKIEAYVQLDIMGKYTQVTQNSKTMAL